MQRVLENCCQVQIIIEKRNVCKDGRIIFFNPIERSNQ